MFVVSMMMELQHLANVGLMLDRSPRQVFEFLGSFPDWLAPSLGRAESLRFENHKKFYNMESQDLNLSPPNPDAGYWGHCVWKSVVQHEFMHALGFDHEQNRPDRDDYIDVHYENVIPELAYNYGNFLNSTQGIYKDF